MRIRYYGYNSFLIDSDGKTIAIDPGGGLYLFKGWLKSLIAESQWRSILRAGVTLDWQ